MMRSSIVSTILVPSLSMQIAVDDRGTVTQLESGIDIGEASEADQTIFENYELFSRTCGKGKRKRGKPNSAGNLQACHVACNHDQHCVAFQFGKGKCRLFKEDDVEWGAENALRCTSKSCCWVQTMDFSTDGGVRVRGGRDDDEGKPERPGDTDRVQLTQLSGFVAVNMTSEMDEFLTEHNKYRCMHGVSPLTWNPTMAQNAATWGSTCCQSTLHHSQSYTMNPQSGENLAAGYGSIAAAVAGWYNEVDDCGPFPGCDEGRTGVTGHFTAMVWAASSQLGCAVNPTGWKNSKLYVCHYAADAPNYQNQYENNVFAATSSESECSEGGNGQSPSPTSPPSPSPTSPPATSPPAPPPPPPSSCPGDRNPTTVRLGGTIATCAELEPYCAGYSFVRNQCPCTCASTPAPTPAPAAGTLGTCCNCAVDGDCASGSFCADQMKKCIPYGVTQWCSTGPDCTIYNP